MSGPPQRDPSTDPTAVMRSIYAFRRNLVLAASAGTGKTHALVGVAVHLLVGACQAKGGGLRPPILPDSLVATTFSRKAAAEIRVRLTEELSKLASGDTTAAYRADLFAACTAARVPVLSEATLIDRANEALLRLGRARIGTLHSFAASIVRNHALVLGLSPDFDLPDEQESRERTVTAIERVLETRVAMPHVASLIELAGGPLELIELLRTLLTKVADHGRGATALALATGDAAELDALVLQMLTHAEDLDGDPKLGEAAALVLAAHGRGDVDALEEAVSAMCGVAKSGKRSPVAEAFFEYRDTVPGRGTLRERGEGLVRCWRLRDQMLPRALALKALLVECEADIARDNLRDSVLSFADVLRAARDVLRDHPGLAVETGTPLEALLVDEFQDTSGVQRDLVYLLWEQPPRSGQVRLGGVVPGPDDVRPEGLLIVGDRKQSIYAFRGADAAVFAELSVGLAGGAAREALAIPAGFVAEPQHPSADLISLRHNRRGEPELLTFANAMSRLLLVPEARPPELYEVDYVPETEDLLAPGPPPASTRPRTHWLRPGIPAGKKTPGRLREAEVIAARISCIVRGGELTVRGAPARYRDIAILGQRHDALAASAYALAEAGIPHVVAGMGFYAAHEVRDVVAMLACLVDPDDTLARAEVLRGPWAGASDRTLVALTDRHAGLADVPRWSIGERRHLVHPDDRAALHALAEVLTTLRPMVGRIGAGPALREAVRALHFEETLVLLPRGQQRVANVRKLLSFADDAPDPVALLHRWRTATDAEHREGEAATFFDEDDAVRLLTVHASKGLAFPVVFLPEAGDSKGAGRFEPAMIQPGVGGRPSTLVLRVVDDGGTLHDTPSYAAAKQDLSRRDAAERRRLRYVAMTRASEAMFFVGDRAAPKAPSEAYATTTTALLMRLSDDDAAMHAAELTVETGESLDRRVMQDKPSRDARPTMQGPLPVVAPRSITLHLDALCDALHCARRYQMIHALGLGAAARPTQAFGSAAGVVKQLASAGAWGARIPEEDARVTRGERVIFSMAGEPGPAALIEATIDFTVTWPDGAVDLLCFDRATADSASDELHAAVLAHAIYRAHPDAAAVRVGWLGPSFPPSVDPRWSLPRDLAWTRNRVREAVARVLRSSPRRLAPRIDASVCQAIHCEHFAACHPPAPRGSP